MPRRKKATVPDMPLMFRYEISGRASRACSVSIRRRGRQECRCSLQTDASIDDTDIAGFSQVTFVRIYSDQHSPNHYSVISIDSLEGQ